MPTKSRYLYDKAKSEGYVKEYMKFKDTGKRNLKFISDKLYKGTNFKTGQPEMKMEYTFKEDGQQKIYETAAFKKDDQGNETKEPSSFIQQMRDFNYGDELVAEYKPISGTPKGFVEVQGQDTSGSEVDEDNIPIIQDDYDEYPETDE